MNESTSQESVAIIGMAGRFPKAKTLEEFWRNLRDGVEAVSFFQDETVQWLPLEHPPRVDDPRYVRARGVLERPEWFDAAFFGMNPREAQIMDPQHRVFLECAWEALENAGCDPERFPGLIGVFAGASLNTYLFTNLLTNRDLVANHGFFSTLIANSGDFVPTRVSYKLNLRGPSLNVQTACSTSLVAVALAAQNLLGYRCDVALAGGVSITFPPQRGQHHLEGGILSSDGHCRAFDAKASGTVLGDGAGVVVLKRLSDALADGDCIRAVIKGSAINNDGSVKIGYTAPSSDGQAEVIALAQAEAGVTPESISYVEAHGTGTPLGDPIEIGGLTKAFGLGAERGQFCAIGSVKSNLGHLDIAAGVAGLIKTVLALEHAEIPPSLHFEAPNPQIDFARTPFFVNHARRPWSRNGTPRRAGVSSFGIGGTNAHVVLEEAPALPAPAAAQPPHLLVLSAKTATALDAATDNLAAHLQALAAAPAPASLADVAFTLQVGRKEFPHRRAVVARDLADAIAVLGQPEARRMGTRHVEAAAGPIVFMFPGQGAQGVNMARELYETEAEFRVQIDRSCEVLKPKLGLDLRGILFPAADQAEAAARALTETRLTQPALFVIEHALARLWMSWGLQPAALIGHSLGEYVAACVSGVFALEDALALVAERARLMQAQAPGAMLAVRAAEAQVQEFLSDNLALAAVNAPGWCVVSGPFDAIQAAEQRLAASAIAFTRLATSHAFHSPMMEPALAPLAAFIHGLKLAPPQIPWVSNVTGKWITAAEATNPEYWTTHLRRTVRFADGVATLLEAGPRTLLEVGPGATLAGLAKHHPAAGQGRATIVTSLGRVRDGLSDRTALMRALGDLWLAGVPILWREGFYRDQARRIVPLPTYPFERQRYYIEPGMSFALGDGAAAGAPATTAAPAAHAQPAAALAEAATTAGQPAAAAKDTSTIAALKALFAEMSGLDLAAADPDASFYELGFDSLFLTQASLAVTRRFGVDVTFRQLRESLKTLSTLATHLEAATAIPVAKSSETTVANGAAASGAEKQLPLTDVQREIWFASQLGAAASSAYNEASSLRLTGPLDVAALGRAVATLVTRHEALRTRFAASGEFQVVSATGNCPLPVDDLSAVPADERSARVAVWMDAETERPFDLVAGPLFRTRLARVSAEEHLLVIVGHHIICDGWSLGVLVREVAELYSAEAARRAPALLPPPSFSAYSSREPDERERAALTAAEKFWREQFADEAPVLELPTDRPRPAQRSYAGGFLLRTLPAELTGAVKTLCAKHDCTPFALLLAAFEILMHRLSGQDDVVVGVPAAAQVMDGLENLVGHFANLLPVRSQLRADDAFGAFLAASSQRLNAALEHWRYPFGRLLQQLNLARDGSRVPLAPVVFNTTRRRGAPRFGGLTAEVVSNPKRFVNFDLNFNFALLDDCITLGCYFSAELYDEATIARWFGHFETLLRAIAANPEAKVGELPLLSQAERRQLLVEWNDTAMPYGRDATIAELFAAQVRATPRAVAIVHGEERVTYAELDARAEAIAARLRASGVGADVLVGLFLERTPHLLAGIFGVLKAGGAYVPLDPAYPADRLEFIAGDARMPIIVTESRLRSRVPAASAQLIVIDEPAPASRPVRIGGATTPAQPTAESLAYVIYTSGSTGRPKGACLTHRCVTALVAWAKQLYRPEELAGVLFSTSASFDISIFEIFCPLCLGGKIIMAENILAVRDLPAADEITFLSGVPSALAEVVRLNLVPPRATTVALAGELFPTPLVDALYQYPQIKRVFEHYGPTEATVYSTGGLRTPGSKPSLGRPFPNERVYVLDRRLQPVPIGVAGELYIGGDKLARGYLNRPELTAEKFFPLPWQPDERVYRTGDGARWLPDGTIEFTSRLDHQVKIRGFRVELGEIETVLRQHADVAECVVLARPDAGGNNRLLAWVVPRRGAVLTAAELRAHVQQRVPDYMVPSALTVLEKFPLTANGKLDRRALPDPELGAEAGAYIAPRTTTEELLAEIWRDVLAVERAGVEDNFFELGGHSLLATQVIARLHDTLGVELTMREFFFAPTIAGMARLIESALIEQIKADTATEPGAVVAAGKE